MLSGEEDKDKIAKLRKRQGSKETKDGRRIDRYGTKILRGKNRKHKVTFWDEVGEGQLAKVIEVESYKEYNVENHGSSTCSCIIV